MVRRAKKMSTAMMRTKRSNSEHGSKRLQQQQQDTSFRPLLRPTHPQSAHTRDLPTLPFLRDCHSWQHPRSSRCPSPLDISSRMKMLRIRFIGCGLLELAGWVALLLVGWGCLMVGGWEKVSASMKSLECACLIMLSFSLCSRPPRILLEISLRPSVGRLSYSPPTHLEPA